MYRSVLVMVSLLVLALGGAASSRGGDVPQHAAITITSNDDFTPPGSSTGCKCVTAGDGKTSPFVIGPWAIGAPSGPGTTGWAVKVTGVSAPFTITGISAGYQGVPASDPFIKLDHVNNAAISNVSANGDGRGVEIDNSSYIALDDLNLNKMSGNALLINGSSHVTLSNSKLKATADGVDPHDADGLYAVGSDHLSIGGVDACPKSRACNTFDYDTGWGVYLQNTDTVTIDHASANADDTGAFILDNASNVQLGNSTAEGDGPICITLDGLKTFTGYHTDMQGGVLLVNGSHDNTIHDVQTAATGVGIGSGGNGFFADPCSNSQKPFGPFETAMGPRNTFTNDCYSSNTVGLPPNPCK
ncbi:MAG: right-handed parallel beta-helix repeat-containing protein [Gaiellaceae bacterium]